MQLFNATPWVRLPVLILISFPGNAINKFQDNFYFVLRDIFIMECWNLGLMAGIIT
jgi:hypothetical protein